MIVDRSTSNFLSGGTTKTTSLLSPISYFERDLICWGGGRDLREGEINQGAKTGRRALIRASASS